MNKIDFKKILKSDNALCKFIDNSLPLEFSLFIHNENVMNYIFSSENRHAILNLIIKKSCEGHNQIIYDEFYIDLIIKENIDVKYTSKNNQVYYVLYLIRNHPEMTDRLLNIREDCFVSMYDYEEFKRYLNEPSVASKIISSLDLKERLLSIPTKKFIGSINSRISISDYYSNDRDFQNKFVFEISPNIFRGVMNTMQVNNPYLYAILNKRRKSYENRMFGKHINPDKLPMKRLIETFIDHYFEDIAVNFLSNLKEMITFIDSLNYCPINEEHYNLYKDIIESIYNNEKISSLYFRMNSKIDYISMFYDDYRICKDLALESLNMSITRDIVDRKHPIDHCRGIKIYEIQNQDFYLLVHSSPEHSKDYKVISLSLISNNCISNYAHASSLYSNKREKVKEISSALGYVTVGFNNFSNNQVKHVFYTDSFSLNGETDKVYTLALPSDLIDRTIGYNEIVYLSNIKQLKPSYVLAYDFYTPSDVRIARQLNVPIYVLDTKKCHYNNLSVTDVEEDEYKSIEQANRITSLRKEIKI